MNTTFNLDHLTADISNDFGVLATFVSDGSDYSNIIFEVVYINIDGSDIPVFRVYYDVIKGIIGNNYDIELYEVEYYEPDVLNSILNKFITTNRKFIETVWVCYKSSCNEKTVTRLDYE